jgi:hypothetical protein
MPIGARHPTMYCDDVHSPGPNAVNKELFRARAGAHLVFNAFWNIQHFCVNQMLMRDHIHQFDLSAIVNLIRGILLQVTLVCRDSIGQGQPRCKTMRQRFELMLAKRNGPDSPDRQRNLIAHVPCPTCNL